MITKLFSTEQLPIWRISLSDDKMYPTLSFSIDSLVKRDVLSSAERIFNQRSSCDEIHKVKVLKVLSHLKSTEENWEREFTVCSDLGRMGLEVELPQLGRKVVWLENSLFLTYLQCIQSVVFRVVYPLQVAVKTSKSLKLGFSAAQIATVHKLWGQWLKEGDNKNACLRIKYNSHSFGSSLERSVTFLGKTGYFIHLKKKDGALIENGTFSRAYKVFSVFLDEREPQAGLCAELRNRSRGSIERHKYLNATLQIPKDLSIEEKPYLTGTYLSRGHTKLFSIKRLMAGDMQNVMRIASPDLKMLLVWVIWIARGLKTLHEADIVHADIKPKNILISLDLQRACIADLEFAVKSGENAIGGVMDLEFLAPEVKKTWMKNLLSQGFSEGESITMTTAFDMYCFGKILEKSFGLGGDSSKQVRRRSSEGDLFAITTIHDKHNRDNILERSFNLEFKTRLYGLITRCLEADPNKRLTASDALFELKNLYKLNFNESFVFIDE